MKRNRIGQSALAPGFVLGALALSACSHVLTPEKTADAKPAGAVDAVAPVSDIDGAVNVAQTKRKAGDLEGATRVLSQLVLVAPDDPRVLGEYGKTLLDKGATDDALAFLQRAAEMKPMDWTLYSATGVAYAQKGLYPAAQFAFARALMLNPGDPTILNNNAMAHLQAGDLDGAEKLLQEAAKRPGENPRIAQNLALVQRLKTTASPAVSAPPQAPGQEASAAQPASSAETAAPVTVAVQQAASETPAPAVALPDTIPQAPLPEVATASVPDPEPAKSTPAPAKSAPVGVAAKPAALAKPAAGQVYIQLASYTAEKAAAGAAARLEGAHVVSATKGGKPVYRVQIGPVAGAEADKMLEQAKKLGFNDGYIFRQPQPAKTATTPASGGLPLRVSDSRYE